MATVAWSFDLFMNASPSVFFPHTSQHLTSLNINSTRTILTQPSSPSTLSAIDMKLGRPGYALSTSVAPAQAEIMHHLDAADLLALSSVSKEIRESVQDGMSSLKTYGISKRLEKFFKHPEDFQWVQAESGALIGGDFARAFFDNATDAVDKLDIYVHNVQGKQEKAANMMIGLFASTGSGYAMANPIDHVSHGPADVVFEKRRPGKTTLTVLLHFSEYGPLHKILGEAITTSSLNFLAWDRAFSLCPRFTFVDKVAHLLQDPEDRENGQWYQGQLNALSA
jgi:hypothetical protein